MKIIKATFKEIDNIKDIMNTTIQTIYPHFYPQEVVTYFLEYHTNKKLIKELADGNIYLFVENEEFVGTGSVENNHISKVFVLPQHQGKGFGSLIMQFLETLVAKEEYQHAVLDASLPAYSFYAKRGYKPTDYHQIPTANQGILCYHVMKKILPHPLKQKIWYHDKVFSGRFNTGDEEVSRHTVFHYSQLEDTVWAVYGGGKILKGLILGQVLGNGNLKFTYQHINTKNEVRIGKGYGQTKVLSDGRLRILATWKSIDPENLQGQFVIEEKKKNATFKRPKHIVS